MTFLDGFLTAFSGTLGESIVAELERSITTASNDDYSDPLSEKRRRHVHRIEAMRNAVDYLRAGRTAIKEAEAAALEQAAKMVEGDLIEGRYRSWPSWNPDGNLSIERDAAKLTAALAKAIRDLIKSGQTP